VGFLIQNRTFRIDDPLYNIYELLLLDTVRATFLKRSLVIDKSFSGPGADTKSGVLYREHVDACLGYGSSA
jgi:hypothetical protein